MALTLGTQIRNPEGTPGMNASADEWAAYREKQRMMRSGGATNNSGMTPQEMEGNVGTVDPDPVKQAMMDLMTSPSTVFNAALIGQYTQDPTYSAPATEKPQQPQGEETVSKDKTILAMAFPEIFLKQPPTGKVNTEGGVERVNARTAEHGTRAIKDKNGHVTLTNINADGSVNQGTGSPNSIGGDGRGDSARGKMRSVIAPDTPLALNSAMSHLQQASDLSTAQGIYLNINQNVAEQEAKLNEEALKFATNKLGIPALEAELAAVKEAEQRDPRWFPGIGDSTAAIQIRNDIQAGYAAATGIAQKYLLSNTRMTALNAMRGNAKIVFEGISRKEEFAARRGEIKDSQEFNRQARIDDRKEMKKDNISMEIGPLDKTKLERLAILDTSVRDGNTGMFNQEAGQMAAYALKNRNKDHFQEVMDQPSMDLPIYAMNGNPLAMTVVVAEERRNNPGSSDTSIRENMNRIKSIALRLTEKDIENFRLKQAQPKDRAAMQQSFSARRVENLGTPKGQRAKQLDMEKFSVALEMERASATGKVTSDAGTILDPRGPFGPAMKDAEKTTGGRSLSDVYTAYKATKIGAPAVATAMEFNSAVEDIIINMPDSVFGKPSVNGVRDYLIESQRSAIREFLNAQVRTAPMHPLMNFGVDMLQGALAPKEGN